MGDITLDNTPMRLKAQTNNANGGIGISYSNVVLAGGIDPRQPQGPIESSYKGGYDPTARERNLSAMGRNNPNAIHKYQLRQARP